MANTGGAASYSAYVGTVIDLVRLMSGLHTAHFQYIPAIAFPDQESLNLRLNTPPSFNNPKSVIVVALPGVQASVLPPLRLQDPAHVSCLLQPSMVLPLEGAPLVFATSFAHDLVLHLNGGSVDGKTDLPMVPDAFDGGLVLSGEAGRKPLPAAAPEARDAGTSPLAPAPPVKQPEPDKVVSAAAADLPASGDTKGDVLITGTLRGSWGFDAFEGVTVPLQRRIGTDWRAVLHGDVLAGRANQLALHADGTACTSKIELDAPGGKHASLAWQTSSDASKPAVSRALEVKLPLEGAAPGSLALQVHQFGTRRIDKVAITAYSDRTRLESFRMHAGDNVATLNGSGLAEVRSVKLGEVQYIPEPGQPLDGKQVRLVSVSQPKDNKAPAGASGTAEAILADGRSVPVPYAVDAARPLVDIITKTVRVQTPSQVALSISGSNDLPLDARITIVLRPASSARFPRNEKIEIALVDGSVHTTLNVADGSLVLQDAHTALAFFSPSKSLGASAFGPLQLRAVAEDGTAGDWVPLGNLVRTPAITSLTCPRAAARTAVPKLEDTAAPDPADTPCTLSGRDLFLIDSISPDSGFTGSVPVVLGFAGDSLSVPRPSDNHTLYLKLRDDPNAVVTLPVSIAISGTPRHGAVVSAPPAAASNP